MKYLNNILLKYFLHKLPPELAHTITLKLIKTGLFLNNPVNNSKNLNIKLGNIDFKHPIGLAAGFDKDGEVFHKIDKLGLSHSEIGTVTPQFQIGNEKPRVFRLNKDSAIINRLGFPSKGLEYLKKRVKKYNSNIPLGINIGCNKDTINQINDYSILTKNLGEYADWITINISSPNTPGLRSIQTSDLLPNLLSAVNNERENIENKRGNSLQVWLKISPDLSDRELKNLIDVSLKHNIDAICISNSTIARSYELKSKNKNEIGGLSGKPLFKKSTETLIRANKMSKAYGNKIFLVTADETAKTQTLLCLSRDTGKTLWTREVHKGGFPEKSNKKASQASCTPATDGNFVYINFFIEIIL